MGKRVEFENIEEMRRQAGIEDVELREAIRGLRIGDFVRITPLTSGRSSPGHMLLARITRIEGNDFRGKLAGPAVSSARRGLRVGSAVAFTAAHIHSVAKDQ
jgi:hypothetical protein